MNNIWIPDIYDQNLYFKSLESRTNMQIGEQFILIK